MSRLTGEQFRPLRRLNIYAGVLHFVSLVAVVILSNDFSLPVTATYLAGQPGGTSTEAILLFRNNVSYTIAIFLGLSAFFHFLVASKKVHLKYEASLKENKNIFRWVEYSLSSSVMIVLIAQLNGMTNYAALIGIFGVNVSMILFGWLQEKYTVPGDGQWLPFIFGCLVGVLPWIIFSLQLISPKGPTESTPPGFVYGIVVSLFLLFNCFAIVQYLQYRAQGKWAHYLRGEKTYIVLSFVAKSMLAWQIFASALTI